MTRFADRAGSRTTENRFKPLRGPGLAHTSSMPDLISMNLEPGVERTPCGIKDVGTDTAGKSRRDRPQGKSCAARFLHQSSIQLGESAYPENYFDGDGFRGYAGKAKSTKQAQVTRNAVDLKSICVVDKLLYGRDLSFQGKDTLLEYAERFSGFAGNKWKIPKKKSLDKGTAGYPEPENPLPGAPDENLATLMPEELVAPIPQEPGDESIKTCKEAHVTFESSNVQGESCPPQGNETEKLTVEPPEAEAPEAPEAQSSELSAELLERMQRSEPEQSIARAGQTASGRMNPFGVRRSSTSSISSSGSRTPSSTCPRPRWH